jgi:hypothetical protein
MGILARAGALEDPPDRIGRRLAYECSTPHRRWPNPTGQRCRQPNRAFFYRADEITALENLINAGAASELDAFFRARRHIGLAMPKQEWAVITSTDLTPDLPGIGRISLQPIGSQRRQSRSATLQEGEALLSVLSEAGSTLEQEAEQSESFGPFKIRRRPAIVLGAPPRPVDETTIPGISFAGLAIAVLPALWRYLQVRDVVPAFLGG